jgi:two-component system alkaline phosphatase synthesis response regulator PhoP
VSRDQLLDKVWGYDHFPTSRTVDNYIVKLRKKIEDDPVNPKHIVTVYGIGYKYIE